MNDESKVVESVRERIAVDIPALTAEQFTKLLEKTGMTRTQLVIFAIDRLYAATFSEKAA